MDCSIVITPELTTLVNQELDRLGINQRLSDDLWRGAISRAEESGDIAGMTVSQQAEEIADQIDHARQIAEAFGPALDALRRPAESPAGATLEITEYPVPQQTVLEPPAYWKAYCLRVVEESRHYQTAAWSILDVVSPVPKESLGYFVRWFLANEPQKGDTVPLEWPEYIDGELTGLPSADAFLGYYRSTRAELEQPPGNALAHVAEMADQMARMVGCERWEAFAFIVSDVSFELPWVRVSPVLRHRAGNTEFTVKIEVSSVAVPQNDVKTAYGNFLELLEHELTEREGPEDPCSRGPVYELIRFVEKMRGDGALWSTIWAEWQQSPLAGRYRNLHSMQQAYYQAVGRTGRAE